MIDQFVFKLLFWSLPRPTFHFQIDQIPESIENGGGGGGVRMEKLQFILDAENRLKSQMPPLFQLSKWSKKHPPTQEAFPRSK